MAIIAGTCSTPEEKIANEVLCFSAHMPAVSYMHILNGVIFAGAKDFVQQAIEGGAKVAIIAGTCSTPEEKMADAMLEKLGVDAADRCVADETPWPV